VPPLDLRLAVVAGGLWLSCLCTRLLWQAGWSRRMWCAAVLLAAVGLLCLLLRAVRRTSGGLRWTLLGITACALAGSLVTAAVLHGRSSGPLAELARNQQRVSLEVVLTGDPRIIPPKAGSFSGSPLLLADARTVHVYAAGKAFRIRQAILLLGSPQGWSALLPSQRIRVQGRLSPPRPGDTVAAALSMRGPPVVLSGPSRLQQIAGSLRAGLRQASSRLPEPERGLLPALVDGDISGLSPTVVNDFKVAGMTHLTAASGANCAIVIGSVLMIVRRTGLRWVGRVLAMVLAIGCFVVIARPSPSVLRSAAMASVAALALVCGRPRAAVPALAGAVTVLLLTDPDLAISAGFALSVAATGGLLILTPRWADRFRRRLPGPIADALAIALAAQVVCTPIIVALSGSVSLVAVPANMLAELAVPGATVLGALATIAAPFSITVARVLALPAGWCCWWLIHVARVGAALPGGQLTWWGGWPGAAAVGGGLILVVSVVGSVSSGVPGPRASSPRRPDHTQRQQPFG
jgi:competence protein ComEC